MVFSSLICPSKSSKVQSRSTQDMRGKKSLNVIPSSSPSGSAFDRMYLSKNVVRSVVVRYQEMKAEPCQIADSLKVGNPVVVQQSNSIIQDMTGQ